MKHNQEVLQKVVDEASKRLQASINEIVRQGHQTNQNLPKFSRPSPSQRSCWYHNSDTHDISQCWNFNGKDVGAKMDLLRKNRGCFICLKTGHISKYCPQKKGCEHCGKLHHSSLHQEGQEGNVANIVRIVNSKEPGEDVLLIISEVKCKDILLSTLWDPGSNISLISHRAARKLNLQGKDVTLSFTKVGNVMEQLHSKEYIIPLTDKDGNTWQIKGYGMEQITTNAGKVDVSGIAQLFNGITDSDIYRPCGEVNLLIGSDCSVLLPTRVDGVGNLQLMKNQFGYCVRGSHSLIKISAMPNSFCINHLSGSELNSMHIMNTKSLKDQFDSFLDIESLGTYCQPRCGGCRCGHCVVGSGHYTIEEEHELNMIETGLKHDDANKCWTINYPWKRNPSELPNNIQAAIGRLRSTEQRLKKTGDEHTQEYQKQIDDMVQRKATRKLSPVEVTSYKGPVHYLPHHEVLKPESSSTPLRIVFNSSASYMGHVINDYWAKGPKVLNDLLSILLKFRENQVGLVGDISKIPPDHYVLTSVPFGDRPSGAIAIIALNKTAEMLEDVYPKAATSDSTFENVLAKDINQVLDFGGFHIKHWIISGDNHQEIDEINIMNTESENVLGLVWKPVDDVFTFKVRLNFSRKTKHKSHEEKSTNKSEEIPEILTRRMVFSQVAGVYDPLGLIVPYTLSAKSLIRNLCQGNQSKSEVWDKPLSSEMRQQWIEFFNGLFQLESLCIPRCLKPTNVFGNPVLVLFF
ncbi:uncharacterized protein LOC134262619 [Saccostrea cucullata]|uniref:uncharacterized protein LOC134262619 n=1 Tax=Saccostrea cuccullata TaxID=36930 RepID=UPI002ED15156